MARSAETLLLDLVAQSGDEHPLRIRRVGADIGPLHMRLATLRGALVSLIRNELLEVRIHWTPERHYDPERVGWMQRVARENGLVDPENRLTRLAFTDHWASTKTLLQPRQRGWSAVARLTVRGLAYGRDLAAYAEALSAGVSLAQMPPVAPHEPERPLLGWLVGTYNGAPYWGTGTLIEQGQPPDNEVMERSLDPLFDGYDGFISILPVAFQWTRSHSKGWQAHAARVWFTRGVVLPAPSFVYLTTRFPGATWLTRPTDHPTSLLLEACGEIVAAAAPVGPREPTSEIRALLEATGGVKS